MITTILPKLRHGEHSNNLEISVDITGDVAERAKRYLISFFYYFFPFVIVVLFCFLFETGSHQVPLAGLELPSKPDWPQTHRHPLASASCVLRFKTSTIRPRLFEFFF